ncbi:MAG: transporter [Polyangiaceae bacterium]
MREGPWIALSLVLLGACVAVARAARAEGSCSDTLVPNRPGATDASGTVGAGCFELESSVAFERTSAALSAAFPEVVRVGLASMVELGFEYDVVGLTSPDGGDLVASPAGSAFTLKINAIEADERRPGFGAEASVGVPGEGTSAGTVEPRLALLFDWSFVEHWSASLDAIWTLPALEGDGPRSQALGLAAVLGYSPPVPGDWLNVYVDTSGAAPLRAGRWDQTVGAGAAFLVRPNVQLDASFSVVATGDEHAVQFGPGFAWQL